MLRHGDPGVREHAALVVRNLAEYQEGLLGTVLESVVRDVLAMARDSSGEVTALADEAMIAIGENGVRGGGAGWWKRGRRTVEGCGVRGGGSSVVAPQLS